MIDITIKEYTKPTSMQLVNANGNEYNTNMIYQDSESRIYIKVEPKDGDPRVEFISSDESIATINSNGYINPIKGGTITITVKSIVNPELVQTIDLIVAPINIPEYLTVDVVGEKYVYMGYKTQLKANIYGLLNNREIVWEVHNMSKDLATIDENGWITPKKTGDFRVRAHIKNEPWYKSSYFTIKIMDIPEPYEVGDMKGYEIVIMNDKESLNNVDPFLNDYTDSDKEYKQISWTEVENKYNCKLVVKAYPDEAVYGEDRIDWIINNATNGTSKCDLAVVDTNWIYRFANANAAIDTSEMYGKYGLSQMEPTLKNAGTYRGKLYVASEGLSRSKVNIELGLFYNYGWIKELGVESPAKLFNEGKWTYEGFKKWVLDVQSKLEENEYVLGGTPYYYYQGMANANGLIIANTETAKIDILNDYQKNASELIYELVKENAVNTDYTISEINNTDNSFWRINGGTMMIPGYLKDIKGSIWTDNMWGEGTTEFGYVPFPYSDSLNKENTKVNISNRDAYMYVAGRIDNWSIAENHYKKIWIITNEMFLNTIKYQEDDPEFNEEQIIKNKLKTKLDDPESIEAIMYYNSKKTIFDASYAMYNSVYDSKLIEPSINVMYKGHNYLEEFNSVYENYEIDFLRIYSTS